MRKARRRAGLTQRALAETTGIAQPTVARIERGRERARMDTVARLLAACGEELEAIPRRGRGVDRAPVRRLLAGTPAQRLASMPDGAAVLDALEALDDDGIDIVIVGGVAARLHGTPVAHAGLETVPAGTPGYDELAANAVRLKLGRLTVAVADLDDLIRRAPTGERPDGPRVDIDMLAAVREEQRKVRDRRGTPRVPG